MAKKKASKSKRVRRPNVNQVRAEVRRIAPLYGYDAQVLLEFAEFVNGRPFKAVEPSMTELKAAVISAFDCSSYQQLKKETSFMLFVKDQKLKMTTKAAWLKAYRKFVGLPDSERNAIGETAINGVDVLRNFLPWKVFDLNPKIATEEDIKKAFNSLAKVHHPDVGGSAEIFDRLKEMRDSLLAAY
ncbi:MAG: J domain-containing protein [Cyanobacteria bacterium P01_C01_bin.89]